MLSSAAAVWRRQLRRPAPAACSAGSGEEALTRNNFVAKKNKKKKNHLEIVFGTTLRRSANFYAKIDKVENYLETEGKRSGLRACNSPGPPAPDDAEMAAAAAVKPETKP